jgi:flagellar protein FliS
MYNKNGFATYAENDINIQSPYKLIELLYEGILKFNTLSLNAMKKNDIENKIYYINRSIAIITELINTLDMKEGNISYYLKGMYEYQIILLNTAVSENNKEKIEESINVFKTMLLSWRNETATI